MELIPRILLRAGYLSYRNGEYDKAIRFLERIPLDDYITPAPFISTGFVMPPARTTGLPCSPGIVQPSTPRLLRSCGGLDSPGPGL